MNPPLDKNQIAQLKESARISDIIGRHVQWDRKKSVPGKGDFWACCPFHGEKSPSFHCEDAKGRYYCFGCGAKGDAISFLTEYVGLTFVDAIREIGGDAPLSAPDPEVQSARQKEMDRRRTQAEAEKAMTDDKRRRIAKALFSIAKPVSETPSELYLLSRKIPAQEWPNDRLRHLAKADYDLPPYSTHPALICRVTDVDDETIAVWRIYLKADGSKAQIHHDGQNQPVKLGKGPAAGGAVRIGDPSSEIAVCEGIETALAVRALTQNRYCVWAALSTSGMAGLEVPSNVRSIQIYADGDSSRFHQTTGNLVTPPGLQAAQKLAERMKERRVRTQIHLPPMNSDWLDVWQSLLEAA